jgi:hypothetical protein
LILGVEDGHIPGGSADDYPSEAEEARFPRAREIDNLIDEDDLESRSTSPSLLAAQDPKWRYRRIGLWGMKTNVVTPNTRRSKGYFLSRLLERFPFLVKCWYWALVYWVNVDFILSSSS